MTVEELIKQLKQYPSNEEVIFMDLSGEENPCERVYEKNNNVIISVEYLWYMYTHRKPKSKLTQKFFRLASCYI